MLNVYYFENFYNQDFSYTSKITDDKSYYLYDESVPLFTNDLNSMLEEKFNM
jgi:hypothetical protein